MKKSLQYPISSGEHFGVFNAQAASNTIWNNLTSASFTSSSTGVAVPTNQAFSDLTVYNPSTSVAYVKLRAKTADGDSTTSEIPVLAGGVFGTTCLGLKSGNITTISFKKANSGDNLIFLSSFVHIEV